MMEELYGTWRLVSYVERGRTGAEHRAFGQTPRGVLSYGRDGRMFAMIVADERPEIAGSREPTDLEAAKLFRTMAAYAGTFTIDGDTATHHVDISWNGSWTGTEQLRTFRIEGNKLLITAELPESVASLVWEKVA